MQRGVDYKRTRGPAYDLPVGRPVPVGTFGQVERDRWKLPAIDLTLDIVEVDGGFNLNYWTKGGLDKVPIEIEFAFDGPGHWETIDQVTPVENGQSAILKAGTGTFHSGTEAITIGPGNDDHRNWALRNSDPRDDRFRVLIALTTPVNHTIEIRYGDWSLATKSLM